MDFNENNGERLFEARNENSVLFSLDNLSAIDRESARGEGGANAPNEASGLINLGMLSQMNDNSAQGGDSLGEPVMGSMTFNQVVTKKNKRIYAIVIAAFVLVVIGGIVFGYSMYKSGQEELAVRDNENAAEMEKKNQEMTSLQEDKTRLEEQVAQLKIDTDTLSEKDQEIAELQKKIRELQLNGGAPSTTTTKPGGGGSARPSGNSGGGGGGSAAAEKPSGPKADPAAIKAALADANKKAAKCAKGGTINISFTLSGSGKVSGMSSNGGTFKGTPSEKCIMTVFEKAAYPTFSGASIPVKYTVKLQ